MTDEIMTLAGMAELRRNPEPAYPEYETIRARARAVTHANPRDPARMQAVMARRGARWCQAVLGYACTPHVSTISANDGYTILYADEAGLNPPACQKLTDWWAWSDDRAARQAAAAGAAARRDREASEAAIAACPVPIFPVANVNPHTRHGRRERLVHATPAVPAVSGAWGEREHPVGRGLCESATRAVPLTLEAAPGEPVTCKNCLTRMPRITAAGQ